MTWLHRMRHVSQRIIHLLPQRCRNGQNVCHRSTLLVRPLCDVIASLGGCGGGLGDGLHVGQLDTFHGTTSFHSTRRLHVVSLTFHFRDGFLNLKI